MRMTVRQLLVFRTVVEQGSFRKSADVLNTSQPSLSNSIKALEDILGVQVFVRTTRSVELTEAGRELYRRTLPIFELMEDAIRATQDVAAGRKGSIDITYVDFPILGPLPEVLENYKSINPDVQINISFARTLRQVELLQEGKIDIGFILDIDTVLPPGFERRQISLEGLVAVVPRTHRLAKRPHIELSDLKDEPFIAGDALWQRYTDLIDDLCVQRGFAPRISQRAYLRDEMLSFVLAGHGVLVYPECIMNAGRFGLSAIPIRDVPKVIKTSAIWRAGAGNPVLPSFLELIPQDDRN